MNAVTCPSCGREGNAPDRLAGKRVACPECKSPVEVVAPVEAGEAGRTTDRPVPAAEPDAPLRFASKGTWMALAAAGATIIVLALIGGVAYERHREARRQADAARQAEAAARAESERRAALAAQAEREEKIRRDAQRETVQTIVDLAESIGGTPTVTAPAVARAVLDATEHKARRFAFAADSSGGVSALALRLVTTRAGDSVVVVADYEDAARRDPAGDGWLVIARRRTQFNKAPERIKVALIVGSGVSTTEAARFRAEGVWAEGIDLYAWPVTVTSALRVAATMDQIGFGIDGASVLVDREDVAAVGEMQRLLRDPDRPVPEDWTPPPDPSVIRREQLAEESARRRQEAEEQRRAAADERARAEATRVVTAKQNQALKQARAMERPILRNAIKYYMRVIEIDPETEQAEMARKRIKSINARTR